MSRGASPPDFSAENSILGRDRRRVARHRAHTPAYANLSGSAQGAEVSLCEILNLTENGMCIQASSQLKTNRLLPLCLELSQTRARIHVVGHVVWSEASGKTGIRFPEILWYRLPILWYLGVRFPEIPWYRLPILWGFGLEVSVAQVLLPAPRASNRPPAS